MILSAGSMEIEDSSAWVSWFQTFSPVGLFGLLGSKNGKASSRLITRAKSSFSLKRKHRPGEPIQTLSTRSFRVEASKHHALRRE